MTEAAESTSELRLKSTQPEIHRKSGGSRHRGESTPNLGRKPSHTKSNPVTSRLSDAVITIWKYEAINVASGDLCLTEPHSQHSTVNNGVYLKKREAYSTHK